MKIIIQCPDDEREDAEEIVDWIHEGGFLLHEGDVQIVSQI